MKTIFLFLVCTLSVFGQVNLLVFAGSTREESYNKKLAREAAQIGKELGAKVTLIDLKDYPMPFYDGDVEKEGMPKNAKRFRDLMMTHQAIVIASPEYNSSIPAVLKNALDWASRDDVKPGSSRAAFKGKTFGLMSASPGKGGGARGLVHLRAVIENAGGEVVDQEVIVPNAHQAFTKENLPALQKEITEELRLLL